MRVRQTTCCYRRHRHGRAALCCFTPLLIALFGAIGLSAIVGKLDYVLLPAMAIFFAVLIYGIAKRHRA
jgi:mercuric ion transport protein